MDVEESGLVVRATLPNHSVTLCIANCFIDPECMLIHFTKETGVCQKLSLDTDNLLTPAASGGIRVHFQKQHLSKIIRLLKPQLDVSPMSSVLF